MYGWMHACMYVCICTPRVERGSPELTGPGRVVCVAGRPSQEPAALVGVFLRLWCFWCSVTVHEVTQLPEAGVLSPVRPELDSLRASSHIWLMRAAAFCEQLALHFWPLQGVQLALLPVRSTQQRCQAGWSLPSIFATIALVA